MQCQSFVFRQMPSIYDFKTIRVKETKKSKKSLNLWPSLVAALNEAAARDSKDVAAVIDAACEKEVRKLPLIGKLPSHGISEMDALLNEYSALAEKWVNVGDLIEFEYGDFLMVARGDLLTGNGIEDGDLIIIRPGAIPENNDIVVILTDAPFKPQQPTLKRINFKQNSPIVTLKSLSSGTEPISLDTSKEASSIKGVYKGLVRTK